MVVGLLKNITFLYHLHRHSALVPIRSQLTPIPTLVASLRSIWCPCARHEGVLGSGGATRLILQLGTRWRWVVSLFTPLPRHKDTSTQWSIFILYSHLLVAPFERCLPYVVPCLYHLTILKCSILEVLRYADFTVLPFRYLRSVCFPQRHGVSPPA